MDFRLLIEERSGGNEIGESEPLRELAEDAGQPGPRFRRPRAAARQSVETDRRSQPGGA